MAIARKMILLLGLLFFSLAGAMEIQGSSWMEVYRQAAQVDGAAAFEAKSGPITKLTAAKVLLTAQRVQTLKATTILAAQVAAAIPYSETYLPDNNQLGWFTPPKQDAWLYRITFKSVDTKGLPTKLSGLVVMPAKDGKLADATDGMIVYMHATTAQRSNAAGDRSMEAYGTITAFGGKQWVLAMPDYLGYGANHQDHPYALGKLNAESGISMIQAARELFQYLNTIGKAGAMMGTQINITGYSEGGGNALWLGRALEARYPKNSPMRPTRIAPMSGPYDLSGATAKSFISEQQNILQSQENFQAKPTLLAFAGVGVAPMARVPLWSLLQTPLAEQTEGLFPGPYSDSTVGARMLTTAIDELGYLVLPFPHPEYLLQPELVAAIETHDLRNRAMKVWAQNDAVEWSPAAPVYLLGIIQDALVPFASKTYPIPQVYVEKYKGQPAPYAAGNAENVIKAMRARKLGSNRVGWLGFNGLIPVKPFTTLSHGDGFVPCAILAERFFAGTPLAKLPHLADPK